MDATSQAGRSPTCLKAARLSAPDGSVECGFGNPMTGIAYTNTPPRMNYELSLQAVRVQGADFFIALTLPIETNYCTIIIGGWGGSLCGISSVDYMDASENQWSRKHQPRERALVYPACARHARRLAGLSRRDAFTAA